MLQDAKQITVYNKISCSNLYKHAI